MKVDLVEESTTLDESWTVSRRSARCVVILILTMNINAQGTSFDAYHAYMRSWLLGGGGHRVCREGSESSIIISVRLLR